MVSKSKTQNKSQKYEVNGRFKTDFWRMFKNLDEAFEFIVENEWSDYFDNMPDIKVIETYPDACEELDGLFPNAIKACGELGTEYYHAAQKFLSKIKIVECYNPGQKGLGHLPFLTWFCMEFAANLRYTLINTALTRFFPHPPKQSWGP